MAFRFGRAPLLRGVLVGGAAYSMGKRGAMNRQQEQEQNAQIAELQRQSAQQQPVQQPATSPATDDPTMAKLTQLGQMRQQGLLTDAEFTAAKAKLLGI